QGKTRNSHMERYEAIMGGDVTKPWVARLDGLDHKYGFRRTFLEGQKDYRDANSGGSRGVYVYYALRPGIYEVNERVTWKRVRRYFIRVVGSEIHEISKDEATRWVIRGTGGKR